MPPSKYYDDGFNPDDLSIKVSEMLVATADTSDELIDDSVTEVLQLLRKRLEMDVVFVSEFVDGQRVMRYVDVPADKPVMTLGQSDPLEQTWCQRVVDGRIPPVIKNVSTFPDRAQLPKAPFDIGTYLSAPILMDDGQVYGTLCCLSFSPHESVHARDLKNLKSVAQLMAKKIEQGQTNSRLNSAAAPLTLKPKS